MTHRSDYVSLCILQLSPVHQGWYINNVVLYALKHVILMKA